MSLFGSHGEAGRSVFLKSINGFATVAALAATLFAAPAVYTNSISFVVAYAQRQYGYGWEDLVALAWGCIVGAGVFFLARMSLATLIIMGGVAIATKLF